MVVQDAAPSGRQVELTTGAHRVTVVEVGGGLRTYDVGGWAVVDGYPVDAICDAGRGQLLLPWPNRVADGAYRFDGQLLQLALTQPNERNAIHGLTRWVSWSLEQDGAARVVATHTLRPQPGYPFTLGCQVDYLLGPDGLTIRASVTNLGAGPAPAGLGFHPYLSAGTGFIDTATLRLPAATRLLTDDRGIPIGRAPVDGTPYDLRIERMIGDLSLDTAFTHLVRDADGLARVRLAAADSSTAVTVWADETWPYLQLFTGDALGERGRRALAIEPMTCAPDAFNNGQGLRVLQPGQTLAGVCGITPTHAG